MPLGRSRNSKRSSSGSSYTSTITTVAFIAVCIIGVWMLTSNSIVPPQITTRNNQATTTTASVTSNTDHLDLPVNEVQNVNNEATENKQVQPVFEDNPGDLPADAIKSDDPKSHVNDQNDSNGKHDVAVGGDDNSQDFKGKESSDDRQEKQTESLTQISEESTTTTQHQETKINNQENSENGATSQESHTHEEQEENVESGKTSLDSQKQEANANQEQERQQKQQKQETHMTESNKEINQNLKSYEEQQEQQRKEDAGIQTMTKESQNEVSEADQRERVKQQQQQQEDQQQQQPQQDQQHQHQQQDQQQQQLQQQKQQDQEEQPHQQQYYDQTSPGKEKSEEKKSENETGFLKTKVDNPKTQQESQDEKTVSTQETEQETTLEDKSNGGTSLPDTGTNVGIPKESKESKKSWSTQATESENQKERRKEEKEYSWQLCNVTAGADYIPCLDNEMTIKQLNTTRHFEHRERHCPQESPTCLVQVPIGYKRPITWPASRDKIWYHNVPHTKLAEVKGHQNWLKVTGEFLTFPGGGTQFIHGAMHYIDFLQQSVPNIKWGERSRVILDVGCGVASFGGYLFEKDVLTMSFAPKDEHEAQVQFSLERGIPAISAVMGSQRLPFPSRVFDIIHCARCRVPWHVDDGMLLLELNRLLRPGGYFVWSATPVYQKLEEDVEIWKAMFALTVSMCWELVTIKKDKLNSIGAAIYRKPTTNGCYSRRKKNSPPMCESNDDSNAAWYVPLQACMHPVPVGKHERGTRWPEDWPRRIQTPPYWLNSSQMGIYGKPAPQDFATDYAHWQHVVHNSYMKGLGISWSNVRNIMDMRAVYGGFAAALKDLKVWVLNVVNVNSPDTLPIIYERGLFGIYHDWCESFSTYPRTYDLLHADHLFSTLKKRCKLAPVMVEVDRIVRPGGKLIVRDESRTIGEVENLLKSLRWEVHLTFSKDQEGLLSAQKGDWRPTTFSASS